MYLQRLQVSNYRAVRKASLTLESSTILIGENDSGKSSLLEALALVLCGENPALRLAPHHVHNPNGSPGEHEIRIRLTFSERTPDEWGKPVYEPLLSLLPALTGRQTLRTVHLEFNAVVPPDGPPETGFRVSWRSTDGPESTGDQDVVALLRRLHPVLWVGAGLPAFQPALKATCSPGSAAPPEEESGSRHTADGLLDELAERGRRILAAPTATTRDELDAAFVTAQKLLDEMPPDTREAGTAGSLTAVISQALGGGRAWAQPAPRQSAETSVSGTAAQKLAVLVLAATLLRAKPEGLPEDAEPILILEDPEAHLHPMTLAAFWQVIEDIHRQRIVTTQSEFLIGRAPLSGLRRLTRNDGHVQAWRIFPDTLSEDEVRRFTYHVLGLRGEALFARCWLLVEGETEFWMLPELARIAGYDLGLEGIACIEFAQAGLAPIIKAAEALGIEWHMLADGDEAGTVYAATASELCGSAPKAERITLLPHRDIEHCFFARGYDTVYRTRAGDTREHTPARVIIRRAIRNRSKPGLGLDVLDAVASRGRDGVPYILREVIETCVELARRPPTRRREKRKE
jgi:putative ATP-dependent endonuclease of OLD family